METYKNSVEHVTDDDDGHDDELAVEEGKRTICKPNGSLITSISNSSLPVVLADPASQPAGLSVDPPKIGVSFSSCAVLLLQLLLLLLLDKL